MGRARIACLHKIRAAQSCLQAHGNAFYSRRFHNISDAGIHTCSVLALSHTAQPPEVLSYLFHNVKCLLRTFGTTAAHADVSTGDLSVQETAAENDCVLKYAPASLGKSCDAVCLPSTPKASSSDGLMFVNEGTDDNLCYLHDALVVEKERPKDINAMVVEQPAKSETAMAMYHILKAEGWSSPDTRKKLSSVANRVTPNLVIEVVKLLKDAQMALSFLHWAKDQEGYEPRVEAFTHVIARFGRERDFNRAWCLLVEMNKYKLAVDYAFSVFIHRLKRAKRAQGIVKAMCGMAFLGVTPSIALYTSALEYLLKFDHGDDATHLYKQMLQDGLVPDKKLYELLIVGFIKIGKLHDSLSLFNDMQCQGYVPHVSVYTALIGSLVGAGKLDRGHELYVEMIGIGSLPKVFGISEVACALHGGNTTEMIDKFLKVVDRTAFRWRIQSHNNLLQYLLDTGRRDEAMEIFDRIPRDPKARAHPYKDCTGCYWTLNSYEIYILGMCKLGYLDHAMELFKEILARDLKPTNNISSFLLLSLSKARRVDEALAFCKHITGTREAISVDAQQCFFSALRISGRLSVALKIFLSMKRKGCIDQDSDFVSLIGMESKDDLLSLMV